MVTVKGTVTHAPAVPALPQVFHRIRTDARYCGPRCRTAAHRLRVLPTYWRGRAPNLRSAKRTLGERLLQLTGLPDAGAAKTGRR
jgi:hypothetical protein